MYTDISIAGATNTVPMKINDHGVIVGYVQGTGQAGFVLKNGSYQILSSVSGVLPSVFESGNPVLTDINNSGVIVGNYLSSDLSRLPSSASAIALWQPFVMVGSTYTTFNVPNAYQSAAGGINDLGQIAGFGESREGPNFFYIRDPDGNFTEFSLPTDVWGPNDLNNNGDMAATIGNIHNAILHSDGTYTKFPPVLGSTSLFYGLNDHGIAVGATAWVGGSPDPPQGFVFRESTGEFSLLSDSFLGISSQVMGINNLGQIVGTYTDSNGTWKGFIGTPAASPVPEIDPNSLGSVLSLVMGSLGLLERRRLKAA